MVALAVVVVVGERPGSRTTTDPGFMDQLVSPTGPQLLPQGSRRRIQRRSHVWSLLEYVSFRVVVVVVVLAVLAVGWWIRCTH